MSDLFAIVLVIRRLLKLNLSKQHDYLIQTFLQAYKLGGQACDLRFRKKLGISLVSENRTNRKPDPGFGS